MEARNLHDLKSKQLKVVIMWWHYYLYWKFPGVQKDFRGSLLECILSNVQWPVSLTNLEAPVWSAPFSASYISDLLTFPPSASTPAMLPSLLCHRHTGTFALEVLFVSSSLPHIYEWLTSSASSNLCSNVKWAPFNKKLQTVPYPLIFLHLHISH